MSNAKIISSKEDLERFLSGNYEEFGGKYLTRATKEVKDTFNILDYIKYVNVGSVEYCGGHGSSDSSNVLTGPVLYGFEEDDYVSVYLDHELPRNDVKKILNELKRLMNRS